MDFVRLVKGSRSDLTVKVIKSDARQTDVYVISPLSYEPVRVVIDILHSFSDNGLVVENVRVGNLGSVKLIYDNDTDDSDASIHERALSLFEEKVFDRDQLDTIISLLSRLPASIQSYHGLKHIAKKQHVTWFPEEIKRGYKFVHTSGHALGFNESLGSSGNVVRIHAFHSSGLDVNVIIKFVDSDEWSDKDIKHAMQKHVIELWGGSKYFKAYRRMKCLGGPTVCSIDDKVKEWDPLHFINCVGNSSHKDFSRIMSQMGIDTPRHDVLRKTRAELKAIEDQLNASAKPYVDQFVQSLM